MSILFGLAAALSWGTGDFFARHLTRRIGTYYTIFYMQFLGIVVLGAYLLLTGELQTQLQTSLRDNAWQPWAWMGLEVLLNIASTLLFMHALRVGKLMLVSPINSSYAAVTVVLSLLSGDVLTRLHALAIAVVLLGVIVTSIGPTQVADEEAPPDSQAALTRDPLQGVGWALLASLGYGVALWIQGKFAVPHLGGIIPVWLIRLLTACLLAFGAPLVRQPLKLPRGADWWYLAFLSIFDTTAYVMLSLGTVWGQIGIVTTLSSLYSVVTVLLAAILLRERLRFSQWLGIGAVFLGIALVNL